MRSERIRGRVSLLTPYSGDGAGEGIPKDANPYTVAGLLSQFIQLLPEPLIPYSLYDGFIKAAGTLSLSLSWFRLLLSSESMGLDGFYLGRRSLGGGGAVLEGVAAVDGGFV